MALFRFFHLRVLWVLTDKSTLKSGYPLFDETHQKVGCFNFVFIFGKPFSRWEGPFCSKRAHFWTPFFGPFLDLMAALLIFGVLIFDPLSDHLLNHSFSWFWMISWSSFHFITFEYISWHLFHSTFQRHYCNIWGHFMTHFMTLLDPYLDQEGGPILGPPSKGVQP